MEREVRYCTTEDGVRIAYSVEGEGPALLVIPLFIGSFSLIHQLVPKYEALLERIGRHRSVILYDVRGTGLSQRDVEDLSPAATLADVDAVVDALNLERFALWGSAFGGPRAIEFAAANPDEVERLVLPGTFARILDAFAADALRGYAQVSRANWDVASRMLSDLGVRRRNEEEGLAWAQWYRQSITGESMARYAESHAELDVSGILADVKCPTLIVHHMDDPLYPFSGAQTLAQRIPAARLLAVEGNASGVTELSVEVQDQMIDFINKGGNRPYPTKQPTSVPVSTLRTVLFTDLAGSTEMMSRLGDERGREVLREHERITREVLKAHGGTEVKTMGDGFMASFGSVTRAVECAIALQRRFAEWNESVRPEPDAPPQGAANGAPTPSEPLQVRCGLNAGEPIEDEGDLFGATVILASRIAAKAEGGEILVADTVRGLCSGKGFLFADRGEFVAKGFEEPVRVFEVKWTGAS